MYIFLQGLMIWMGIIISIGAQNLYILRQGLLKQSQFIVASIFFLGDVTLTFIGTFGLGQIIAHSVWFSVILSTGGIIFLFFYGLGSLKNVFTRNVGLYVYQEKSYSSLKKIILGALAVTFLNPHVYLDTFIILGSITIHFNKIEKIYFLMGVFLVSAVWFYGVAYAARLLQPIFRKQITWKVMDIFTTVVMWTIAIQLMHSVIKIITPL